MTMDEFENLTKSNEAILVYFSGEHCGVCKILKPKIFEAFEKNYPKIALVEIQTEQNLQLARNLNIFAMPTILVYFGGQEFQRKERNISVDGFINDVKRPYTMFFS